MQTRVAGFFCSLFEAKAIDALDEAVIMQPGLAPRAGPLRPFPICHLFFLRGARPHIYQC